MYMRKRTDTICTYVSFVIEGGKSNLVRVQRVQFMMVGMYSVHANGFHGQRTQRLFLVGE